MRDNFGTAVASNSSCFGAVSSEEPARVLKNFAVGRRPHPAADDVSTQFTR
jgi:hypothetical protein